jgi:hypothetical protein
LAQVQQFGVRISPFRFEIVENSSINGCDKLKGIPGLMVLGRKAELIINAYNQGNWNISLTKVPAFRPFPPLVNILWVKGENVIISWNFISREERVFNSLILLCSEPLAKGILYFPVLVRQITKQGNWKQLSSDIDGNSWRATRVSKVIR